MIKKKKFKNKNEEFCYLYLFIYCYYYVIIATIIIIFLQMYFLCSYSSCRIRSFSIITPSSPDIYQSEHALKSSTFVAQS